MLFALRYSARSGWVMFGGVRLGQCYVTLDWVNITLGQVLLKRH